MCNQDAPLSSISEFVDRLQGAQLNADIMAALQLSFVDTMANLLAGLHCGLPTTMKSVLAMTTGRGDFQPFTEASAPLAIAWHHAMAIHLADFDDNHDVIGGHPSTVLLPALFAVGARMPTTALRELWVAYAAGMEVECKLGRCLNYRHYNLGWHPTATLGVMGAAVAVAKLLGLSRSQIAHAVALAASMASGLKENFGTDAKPFQVGHASGMGVLAAFAAKEGIEASQSTLDGPRGFGNVYNQTPVDWSPLQQLSQQWDILDPGLVIKCYPCCASTHASIDTVLELRGRNAERVRHTRQITVRVHPDRLPHVDKPHPTTPLEAKFSIQYVAAHALIYGFVDTNAFDIQRIHDANVQQAMQQVQVISVSDKDWPRTAAETQIEFLNGDRDVCRTQCAKGHGARNPVSVHDIEVKYASLAGHILPFHKLWRALQQENLLLGQLFTLLRGCTTQDGGRERGP